MRRAACSVLIAGGLLVACSDADEREDAGDAVAPAASTTPVTVTVPGTTTTTTTTTITTTTTTSTTTTTIAAPVYDFGEVDAIVARFVDDEGLDGAGLAIVERDGGIVHEAYWGDFGPERVSLVASASKNVSAGVLLHLADEGLLDMDVPVAEALAGDADWTTAHPDITPAQLVSHSSGLVGLLPQPGYAPYRCQFDPGADLQRCAATIFTTPDDDADVVPPDTEYRYGGGAWQVAGAVAELASGRTWAELVDDTYVEPCDLGAFGYHNPFALRGDVGFGYPSGFDGDPSVLTPTANPNLEGGLYTTVVDYATVLLMQLRDGRCGDAQVLSTDALARMHADRTGQVYGSDIGYGMGWWVDRSTGRLTDPGAYGAVAWLDLDAHHGGFLVLEADAVRGARLAGQIYEPVAAALSSPST